MAAPDPQHPYVSRGGLKLEHALREFAVDPAGLTCADLGCSTGGFTDCLLQHGAARIYTVDTGYGVLAWKLRNDPRVIVMERTNALHAEPPAPPSEPVDLVTIDMGWTPQRLCIPAALRWLRTWSGPPGRDSQAHEPQPAAASARAEPRIITLIKPHYELSARDPAALPRGGVLPPADARQILDDVLAELPALGVTVDAVTQSPIVGSKGRAAGNVEYLASVSPA